MIRDYCHYHGTEKKKKTEKICTASLVIIKISVRIVSLTKRKNIKRIKNRVKQ